MTKVNNNYENIFHSTSPTDIELPQIMRIRLGEYGRQLEEIWNIFKQIRINGKYAADNNLIEPAFSQKLILYGLAGRHRRIDGQFYFFPPEVLSLKRITTIGVLSSDVQFEGSPSLGFIEDETSGAADFFVSDKSVGSIPELITYLRKRLDLGKEYITDQKDGPDTSTLMFVFDSSRPELAPLMQYSMKDDQSEKSFWPNKLGHQYIDFPMKGSGLHIAVPVGIPANYIEYILINEQSSYWQGDRFKQLRESSVCDGHQIPLVSVNSGVVI